MGNDVITGNLSRITKAQCFPDCDADKRELMKMRKDNRLKPQIPICLTLSLKVHDL